jgi:hypothetical protein
MRVSIDEPHNNGFVVGNDEVQAIQTGKQLDGPRFIPVRSPINTLDLIKDSHARKY